MTQLNGLGLQLFDMARRPYGPMFPPDVESATPTAFLRTPRSVNLGGTLLVTAGAGNPALTLSGNLNQALGIRITIATPGAPGTAKVNISINNGASNLETNVSTTAGTHPIGSTGANLVFPASGAYAVGQIWEGICSSFSDQIGANNFTNSTSGQRPTVLVAGQGGVAALHFDATNDVLNCTTSLANTIAGGGVNTPFTILALVKINTLPSGANLQTIMTLGNTGSSARAELQYTATSYRIRRIDNTGAQSLILSAIPVTTGLCLIDWRFDGTNSTLAVLGADVIGGRSDVSGANALAGALTLNNVSFGAQKGNGTTGVYAAIDAQALYFCQGALDDEEMGRVRQYFATEYGFQIFTNADVMNTVTFFAGATKGTAAEHWMTFSGQPGLMLPQTDSDLNNTFFGFRQPLRIDGVTPYWYYQGTGDPATEQAIVDEHIAMMSDAGLKAVVPLYFTRPEDITLSNQGTPAQAVIWQWFNYYMSSQYKSRMKFAVMCTSRFASFDANSGPQPQYPVSFGTFLNLPDMATYWASLMLDPQYLRNKDGWPYFYIYNDPGGPWTSTHLSIIRSAAQAVGFPNVRFVNPNENATLAASLGTQMTSYGPNSSVFTGQNSFQTQVDKDRSFWAISPTIAKQVGITLVNDGRVVRGTSTWWVDRATYSELENHIEQTFAYARISRVQVPDHVVQAYSGGEWAEGGDFFFTRQTVNLGVNTPTRGINLDAYHNVVNGTYPPAYWDWYHAGSKNSQIVRTGTWTLTIGIANGGGSNPAPFDFSEIRASAAATLTFSPNFVRDQIQLFASKGPTYGTFNLQLDGGAPSLIVLTDAVTSYNNLVYDSGPLAPGTHTLTLTWVSGLIACDRLGAHRLR